MKLAWLKTILILIFIGPNVLVNSQKQSESISSREAADVKLDSKLQKALAKVLSNLTSDDPTNPIVKLRSYDNKNEEKNQIKKIFDVHAFSAEQQIDGGTIETISHDSQDNEGQKINFVITKNLKPTIEFVNDATGAATNSVKSDSENLVTTKSDISTTTTLQPPINDPDEDDLDGANKDKVEEVQFFPASLVAAFTVQQDSLGLPHNVIPLIREESSRQNSIRTNVQATSLANSQNLLDQRLYQLQQERKLQEELLLRERQRQQDILTQNSLNFAANNFPNSFDERKRILEQQLYELQQEQQRHQHELSLKERQRQQELEQQRLLQLQEEQRLLKLRQEEERRQQFLRFQREENQRLQQQQSARQNLQSPNSFVTIFPSIALEQRPTLVTQQFPSREAVDFLTKLRKQNVPEFPLEQNHIPLNFNQALPHLQQINIQQVPTLRSAQFLAPTPVAPVHHNRVFRQETQTGNLGINTVQSNSFNNDFVRPPTNFNEINRHLRHLLRQNGLTNSNREELNVISKVLSLNHFGGDFHGILRRSDNADSTSL